MDRAFAAAARSTEFPAIRKKNGEFAPFGRFDGFEPAKNQADAEACAEIACAARAGNFVARAGNFCRENRESREFVASFGEELSARRLHRISQDACAGTALPPGCNPRLHSIERRFSAAPIAAACLAAAPMAEAGGLRASAPRGCCSSSVVEHSLGKGEAESSILSCSTTNSRPFREHDSNRFAACLSPVFHGGKRRAADSSATWRAEDFGPNRCPLVFGKRSVSAGKLKQDSAEELRIASDNRNGLSFLNVSRKSQCFQGAIARRPSNYESGGQEFESLRARQQLQRLT